MPTVQTGTTSFMLGKKLPALGIPRLRVVSGTTDPKTFAKLQAMLDDLASMAKHGDTDALVTLQAIHDRSLAPLQALATIKQQGTEGLTRKSRQLAAPKAAIDPEAFEQWLATAQLAQSTRKSYRDNYKTLMLFKGPSTTMADLPWMLTRYRESCVKQNRNERAFNIARSVCMSWARDVESERLDTYTRIRGIKPLKEKPDFMSRDFFSPQDVRTICAYLPVEVSEMLWFMSLHGTNPKEYFVDGVSIKDGLGLGIHGQKHQHRQRYVPLMVDKIPSAGDMVYPRYYKWIKKAAIAAGFKSYKPNDARRAFMRWIEESGVPHARVMMYGGHAPQTQTQEYQYAQVKSHLEADRKRFRTWLEDQLKDWQSPPDAEPVTLRKLPSRAVPIRKGRGHTMQAAITQPKPGVAKPSKSPVARATKWQGRVNWVSERIDGNIG